MLVCGVSPGPRVTSRRASSRDVEEVEWGSTQRCASAAALTSPPRPPPAASPRPPPRPLMRRRP
eukprot:4659554-Prymnesium_polylepis.1